MVTAARAFAIFLLAFLAIYCLVSHRYCQPLLGELLSGASNFSVAALSSKKLNNRGPCDCPGISLGRISKS